MAKTKEKPYSIVTEGAINGDITFTIVFPGGYYGGYGKDKKLNNSKIEFLVRSESTTSSCGSGQIAFWNNFLWDEKSKNYKFTKIEKLEILEKIFELRPDYNNWYFLDCDGGHMEKFFRGLNMFKPVWNYLNKNSENKVTIWAMNRWADEEVQAMINESDDDSW